MARFYYYVVSAGDKWEVKFEGQKQKFVYNTQAEAINAAAGAAKTVHGNGTPSGVRIQADGGRWRDERTYGDDPFPPRG